MRPQLLALAALALCLAPQRVCAHIGSPDVYLDGDAGPYKLLVTVRMPTVIPGVAELDVRSEAPGVESLSAVPIPMSGPGATFAPLPDKLKQSAADPQFFTGALWLMAPGSWQIKLAATGVKGPGVVSIPVPTAAQTTKKMQPGLGALLSALMTFLVFGMVAIAGAAVREAKLAPGAPIDERRQSAGWKAMGVAAVVVISVVAAGRFWWASEEKSYAGEIYKPTNMDAAVTGTLLRLKLHDPGWLNTRNLVSLPVARSVDDLVPDHDHLMHLYALGQPSLDVVYHLHPDLASPGTFELKLPSMPAGSYKLYADIVHGNGFPETLLSAITVPAVNGRVLSGDDASATAPPWQNASPDQRDFTLPDGYRMRWIASPPVLHPKQALQFQFELRDAAGRAPVDMALYMGMLGHAAFVQTDGTVFAHLHPNGTVSMAAFMQAQKQVSNSAAEMANMPGMQLHTPHAALPNVVSFPYGFPTSGRYRIFVQMKHGETVETGVFDAVVVQPPAASK